MQNNWGRKWQPIPVWLPGKSHGQRSLAGTNPWGCKEKTWLNGLHTCNTREGNGCWYEDHVAVFFFSHKLIGLQELQNTFFQVSSVTQSCLTLCELMNGSTPGLPVHHQLPEFTKPTSIELVMPSMHLILCNALLLLPPIPPSIRVFSNESPLHMSWPKYWSFSFSIIPSKEHPGLISFRMHWLDLLAVQGTLKSLLQHHSSKASILQCSAFFTVQLSHPYMTTRKTIALTRWTFFGKVMSLLFNMPSRLVINILPKTKRLLISRLQSPSAVKSDTVSTVFPIYFPWSDGTECHDLRFLNF